MTTPQGQSLDILYRDDDLIAVDKPSGLLVHRTNLSADNDAVLQRLRDQIGSATALAERVDRQTELLEAQQETIEQLVASYQWEATAKFVEENRYDHGTLNCIVRCFDEGIELVQRASRSRHRSRIQDVCQTQYVHQEVYGSRWDRLITQGGRPRVSGSSASLGDWRLAPVVTLVLLVLADRIAEHLRASSMWALVK
jgi:hypothetical protein